MIRRASIDDLDSLCNLLREAHKEESRYKGIAHHEAIARTSIKGVLENHKAAVFVLDDDGIKGVYAGVLVPMWWCLGDTATQLFLYVEPSHRGKGWLLVKAFTKWAESQASAKYIMCGNSFSRDDRVDKLFLRIGFEKHNTVFFKEV
jgi:GNAT superfamily N-acetyltransferase